MRILINSHLMDRKTKFQIEHSKKNIINIESSVESHSSNSIGSSHDDIEQLEKWIEDEKRRLSSQGNCNNSEQGQIYNQFTKKHTQGGVKIGYKSKNVTRLNKSVASKM